MDYDSDVLAWSEAQASLLRRVAAGEPVNGVDWPNVIEEIESVGRDQLHAVESLLVQALLHELKAASWPDSRDVPHWRAEARRFRDDAASRFPPSMRGRLDLDWLTRRARRAMPETIDGVPPLPVADVLPGTLDDLLADE